MKSFQTVKRVLVNSMDKEEQKINEWMKNPVIPNWLKAHIKQPESSNTLHYDETIGKYIYTPTEGEVLYFASTAEAHDDSRVERNNTKLIGEFPDLVGDREFGQTTKDDRLLFFGTNKEHFRTFLYRIYLCEDSEKRYIENPFNFFTAQQFISNHMLNWRVDEKPIHDYWFEDHSHISKIALIHGQSHIWQAGTKVCEKPSMIDEEFFATGNTIEQAIVKLAAKIYETYTWEGYKK